jgi:hypothetical protein
MEEASPMAGKTQRLNRTLPHRGFLLLVIVGILSVLLVVCVGFLAYARSEVSAVANIRDKTEGLDICESAVDWVVGNICADLLDGSNHFKTDNTGLVSNARAPGEVGYRWWYRPHEKGLKDCFNKWANQMASTTNSYPYSWKDPTWNNQERPDCVDSAGRDQAEWVWLPGNYFPTNAIRGRFMVQVLDPNAFINLNDNLEDCMPTQCQMAHMLMDGYGEQELERFRSWRDNGPWVRTPTAAAYPGKNDTPDRALIRYEDAWRIATRTVRYCWWNSGYEFDRQERMISPNWVTTNMTWFSAYGAEWNCLKPGLVANGIFMGTPDGNDGVPISPVGPGRYYPPTHLEGNRAGAWTSPGSGACGFTYPPAQEWNKKNKQTTGRLPFGMPFSTRAYVDPDTGRCPVNVNTVFNSGERLPSNVFNGTPSYTMEGVFNVESLRRIIKVGSMTYTNTANVKVDLPSPAAEQIKLITDPANRKLAWNKHENLRTKLASMYQEVLCRYFTATYRHSMKRKWPPYYNPTVQATEDFSDAGTYQTAFGAGALPVQFACQSFDYNRTRFPFGLLEFRRNVKADLQILSAPHGEVVNFSNSDLPSVPPGQLDRRTAAAVFDNIVPGKPAGLLGDFGITIDPLLELYTAQIARDELSDCHHEAVDESGGLRSVFGYVYDSTATGNGNRMLDSGVSSFQDFGPTNDPVNVKNDPARWLNLRAKGRDLVNSAAANDMGWADSRTVIPYRQYAFGPDWFSTELTATTTNFICIVNAQIVDAASADPALGGDWDKPRDLYAGQWGYSIEIAPDVHNESAETGATDWLTSGLAYYSSIEPFSGQRLFWPAFFKTTPAEPNDPKYVASGIYSMDKFCSTLKTLHPKKTKFPKQVGQQVLPITPLAPAGPGSAGQDHWSDNGDNSSRYRRTSAAKIWTDYRGVSATDAIPYYRTGGSSVPGRVVVRAIWTNQGVNR